MSKVDEQKLPDFEDMYRTLSEISELAKQKAALELKIDAMYSDVVKTVTSDPVYYIKDKPPSMAYIQATYFVKGLDGELLPLRQELADITNQLNFLNNKMKLDNSMVDVWRTQSANRRRM